MREGKKSPLPGNPPEYRVIPEKRLVCVKFGKRVTLREIATYAASVCTDPLFDPQFSEIVDLREVEELDLHGQEMLKLADEVDPFSLEAKRAFVVRDRVQTHAAQMHKLLRIAKEKIAICHSIDEAERWIGIGHRC